MSGHTPGPWSMGAVVVGRGDGSTSHRFIQCASGAVVAAAYGNCTVATEANIRANAQLIAAAPELLKTLQEILADMESVAPKYRCRLSIKQARDAIAQAVQP